MTPLSGECAGLEPSRLERDGLLLDREGLAGCAARASPISGFGSAMLAGSKPANPFPPPCRIRVCGDCEQTLPPDMGKAFAACGRCGDAERSACKQDVGESSGGHEGPWLAAGSTGHFFKSTLTVDAAESGAEALPPRNFFVLTFVCPRIVILFCGGSIAGSCVPGGRLR